MSGFEKLCFPLLLLQLDPVLPECVCVYVCVCVCVCVCVGGWGVQSDPSELILNEINKFRLNWQLASKVIIPSLMSPLWKGKRLGFSREAVGCVKPGFSSTKK